MVTPAPHLRRYLERTFRWFGFGALAIFLSLFGAVSADAPLTSLSRFTSLPLIILVMGLLGVLAIIIGLVGLLRGFRHFQSERLKEE